MRALRRKLLRDLWRLRGQALTIALVLAAGIAAFVSLTGTYRALHASMQRYYAERGFADLFVHLERAPLRIAAGLEAIPGVATVTPRLSEPVRFRLPGVPRPPTGRAVSLARDELAAPRSLALQRGRAIDPARADEALLLDTFARAHGLHPGDRLEVVLERRAVTLAVAGTVLSPEWVFPAELGPAGDGEFGVVWMAPDALAALVGRRGAFDDATLTLAPGANPVAVRDAVDRALAPWGGQPARDRAEQPSHRALSGELDQLRVLATQVPALFLAVAAFLLHVELGRLVHLQREQLAVLRALGFSRGALARHVLALGIVIVALGVAVGGAVGLWLAGRLTALYARFFHFPTLDVRVDGWLVAVSASAAGVAALAGTLSATWRTVRLAPAEAMRPPAPARYRRGVLSRLGLARLAGRLGRLVVRDLERKPAGSAVAVLGLASALAVVILGRFSVDAVDFVVEKVMVRSLREDVAVALARPVPRAAVRAFAHAPGVVAVEPLRTLPVRIRNGHRRRDVVLSGWPRDATLRRVLDGAARPVALPAHGLLLTALLADRLGLRPGDPVEVERLDGDRRRRTLPLAAVVDERLGLNAYLPLDDLAREFGEPPAASVVLLQADRARREALLAWLAEVPAVATVSEPRAVRDSFYAHTGETLLVWALVVVSFGGVIAIGIVYNTARIALSERSRDLATLRVLGFTRGEVAGVLLGQLAVQVALALPAGFVAGKALASTLMGHVDPERFRFPVVVSPATYAFAALVVLGAALVAAAAIVRRLARLDVTSALEARD